MRSIRLWSLAVVVALSATLVTAGAQAPQPQGDQSA